VTTQEILLMKCRFYSKEIWGKEYKGTLTFIENDPCLGYFGIFANWKKTIEIDVRVLKHKYMVDTVILHELCHWWCYINKLGWDDEDKDFLKECKKVGDKIVYTEYKRFVPTKKVRQIVNKFERSLRCQEVSWTQAVFVPDV